MTNKLIEQGLTDQGLRHLKLLAEFLYLKGGANFDGPHDATVKNMLDLQAEYPNDPDMAYNLALMLKETGRREQAIAFWPEISGSER